MLFAKKDVFISDQSGQKGVFEEISKTLLNEGLVKNEFLENLVMREKNFPTGIDLSVVDVEFPNVAIPHTEGEFVNVRRVIPIKLLKPIRFFNMIQPEQELKVSFMFMILNNDPEGQANVLAQIMQFLTTTSKEKLKEFFEMKETDEIYNFLNNNFE
ncbi:PTS sugar transporter subunit IIA [Liquorilactobacillus nagelii]|uniref:PTS sugar transporter subunit IIA n=1 Tax=Liquorilactobacillus nagelii TaxID=82688 RepID=UPI00070A5833|nr:PTS sugar transporter subunit IIA [Liquorilactobacillus nagelii]QYH55367.1 PTS sugar transporter subunit IIA [Liquorilactobacillus nagelii DSM 13675]QYH55526.1 PTS sugar transporter subunit IIA [Liquorilactobacillus nagelii DSM 13675]